MYGAGEEKGIVGFTKGKAKGKGRKAVDDGLGRETEGDEGDGEAGTLRDGGDEK
jgi:hypothetical protein